MDEQILELIGQRAKQLRELDPKHELLAWTLNDSFVTPKFFARFWDRPKSMDGQPESVLVEVTLRSFLPALKRAVKSAESQVRRAS